MGYRLSICIATRNRAKYIGETLSSIASQVTDGVEVVVLDGASTDGTPEVVEALVPSMPYLNLVRKTENGGVDRDYDEAVTCAGGDYCWLLSDDDPLLPGALDKVLAAIGKAVDLVVVNSELRTFGMDEVLDPNRLRLDQDRHYGPGDTDRLFAETSAYLTYIGAVVIRRSLWMSRDREACFGSYFIHVGVIFQAALPNGALVLASPGISIRFGNTQWRPKEFEIRMVRWTELVWSLAAVSEGVRSRLYRKRPWTSAKSLFFYRAKGTYDISDYHAWVFPRTSRRWERWLAATIARFPGSLANLIGLLVCRIPYRDSNIHLLDMKASRYYLPYLLGPGKGAVRRSA